MKCTKIAAAIMAVLTMACASIYAIDARDGLVAWWVSRGDLNKNNVVDADELVDLVNYSAAELSPSAESVIHMTAEGTEAWQKVAPIVHSNATIRIPAGQKLMTVPVIYFQAPTNLTSSGEWAVQPQSITLPCANMDIEGPITIITRVKPCRRLGKDNESYKETSLIGYDYSFENDTGILLNFKPDGNHARWSRIGCSLGWNSYDCGSADANTAGYPDPGLDYWHDVGVSVVPNAPEAGKSTIIYFSRRNDWDKDYTGNKTFSSTSVVNRVVRYSNASARERKILLGNKSNLASTGYTTDSKSMAYQYRGPMQFVKIYNRGLSVEEFDQACLPTEEPLWSIGARNGSAAEFSDTEAESTFEPDSMPWHKFRKSLTAFSPSVGIRCNIMAEDRQIPRVLQMKVLGSGGFSSGNIDIAVNGTVVGTVPVEAGEESLFFLETSMMELVTESDGEYPMTISLTRSGSMAGTLSFDFLALQGGWQLGTNNTSYSEFGTWGNPWTGKQLCNFTTYYVGQRDWKARCGQYTTDTDYRWQTVRFFLTDKMARKCGFEYKIKGTSSWYQDNVEHGFEYDVYLNGKLYDDALSLKKGETRTYVFEPGELNAGANEIKAYMKSSTSNSGFDYIRLSPVKKWRSWGFTVTIR